VTLRLLADLSPRLLRLHGQRDELGLAAADLQRAWLDRSGGEEAGTLLARVAEAHRRWAELAARLARLRGDERLRAERVELLRFEVAQIDAVRPLPGEEDELRREREALRHRDAIVRALGGALELLHEGEGAAGERLAAARETLAEVAGWEPAARAAAERIAELVATLDDAVAELRSRLPEIDADPGRLDVVEDRLAALERLLRRHGGSTREALAARARLAAELAEIDHDSGHRDELAAAADEALAAYREAALALSAGRARWGSELAGRLRAELAELACRRRASPCASSAGRATAARWSWTGARSSSGRSAATSSSSSSRPTRRGAAPARARGLGRRAGAGLPRPAARGPRRGAEESATLVFDEVDAGIGGAEAAALGRKLQRLATGRQILAVTHLPQVACFADRHFRVGKRVEGGRTFADVRELDPSGRVEEVARMLGERR